MFTRIAKVAFIYSFVIVLVIWLGYSFFQGKNTPHDSISIHRGQPIAKIDTLISKSTTFSDSVHTLPNFTVDNAVDITPQVVETQNNYAHHVVKSDVDSVVAIEEQGKNESHSESVSPSTQEDLSVPSPDLEPVETNKVATLEQIVQPDSTDQISDDQIVENIVPTDSDTTKSDELVQNLSQDQQISKEALNVDSVVVAAATSDTLLDKSTEIDSIDAIEPSTLADSGPPTKESGKDSLGRDLENNEILANILLDGAESSEGVSDSLEIVSSSSDDSLNVSILDSTIVASLEKLKAARQNLDQTDKESQPVDPILQARRLKVGKELSELISDKISDGVDFAYQQPQQSRKSRQVVFTSDMKPPVTQIANGKSDSLTVLGQNRYSSLEIGGSAGYSSLAANSAMIWSGLASGIKAKYYPQKHYAIGLSIGIAQLSTSEKYSPLQTQLVHADVETFFHFFGAGKIDPHISLGLGFDHFDAARIDSQISPTNFTTYLASAGVNIPLGQHLSMNVSVKYRYSGKSIVPDIESSNYSHFTASAGISYRHSKSKKVNSENELLADIEQVN